jgi:hypothetical protein
LADTRNLRLFQKQIGYSSPPVEVICADLTPEDISEATEKIRD